MTFPSYGLLMAEDAKLLSKCLACYDTIRPLFRYVHVYVWLQVSCRKWFASLLTDYFFGCVQSLSPTVKLPAIAVLLAAIPDIKVYIGIEDMACSDYEQDLADGLDQLLLSIQFVCQIARMTVANLDEMQDNKTSKKPWSFTSTAICCLDNALGIGTSIESTAFSHECILMH